MRSFLDHTIKEAETEIGNILRKAEEGEFSELEDLEAALDDPFMRQ